MPDPVQAADSTGSQASAGAGPVRAARWLVALFVGSALFRLALAAFATEFTLVDDAYIHLRYARNLVQQGAYVYNPGEAVFGLTSPLYGLLAAALFANFGSAVEVALIVCNILLWSAAGLLISRELPRQTRFFLLSLFLLAPVFVDNQLLGMETPLLVLLLAGSVGAARRGELLAACLWFGPALITRPEAVLLAPFLILLVIGQQGLTAGMQRLLRPLNLLALLAPGIAWVSFALFTYGSILPQSMVAKTGWGSTHYASVFTLQNAILTLPRLSFLPFIDRFPMALQWALTALLSFGILWVLLVNLRRGSATSRAWLGFYVTYISFYLLGKGATEASWYAVPSSVALLVAAAPCLPRWLTGPGRIGIQLGWALLLAALSAGAALQRAPLLKYYVSGYGACADFLEQRGAEPGTKVAIGEIGVFGYHSSLHVVDVAALVSPETLPWRNAGYSFTRMVQESGAEFFVISEGARLSNTYPALSAVWNGAQEQTWFETRCQVIAQFEDKLVYEVLAP